jgi:hypothetical protein
MSFGHDPPRSRGTGPDAPGRRWADAVQAKETGPFDVADAPDDGVNRVDLVSIRLPVPADERIQVDVGEHDVVTAVHVVTELGQFTVTAYAAPPSGRLWEEVIGALAEEVRLDQGAVTRDESGIWGRELVALTDDYAFRFVGVNGPRWLLRGVAVCPHTSILRSASFLRSLLRGTVVVRGDQPLADGSPLPIDLPAAMAEHIAIVNG